MRTREQMVTGAALILLAGCKWDQQPEPGDIRVSFREAMIDGRLGFKLWVPEQSWKRLTQHASGVTSVVLDEQVHASVNSMIERGIIARHLPYPHQWRLS